MMKMKCYFSAVLAVLLIFSSGLPAFSLSQTSSRAIEAFQRYESDFNRSLNRLKDLGRKVESKQISLSSPEGKELLEDAGEINDYVQKRYDLMDDLFKSVSADNPDDRNELFEAFQRIDDLYRQCRDFYQAAFGDPTERESKKEEVPASPKDFAPPPVLPKPALPPSVPSDMTNESKLLPPAPQPAPSTTTPSAIPKEPVSPGGVKTPAAVQESYELKKSASGKFGFKDVKSDKDEEEKVRYSGRLKFSWKNRNDRYPAQNSVLPNNQAQSKFSIQYAPDEKNKYLLEDKYIHRKRNELVKENVLTLSYLHNHSPRTAFSAKDTLHHIWYPANSKKNYRDNLFELFLNKKERTWERYYNVGLENRKYPEYSKSDFTQLNLKSESTLFIPNGTIFSSTTWNGRDYKNSHSLDYMNTNYDIEYNQNFNGNKSEISISDTYDKRHYGNEAVNLFRSNYWDNYFQFRYDLPVSKTWRWLFEDSYQQRLYASDFPRGYSKLNLKTTGKITIDKDTRARISHTYTKNNENTSAKAHRNNQFNGMWEKKFSQTLKVKLEDNYHRRNTVVGDTMDFRENLIRMLTTLKLPSKIELTWKNEYLSRLYSTFFYRDYRYYTTGLLATYSRPKKFDWQLTSEYRKFSNRNANNKPGPWVTQTQPLALAKVNFILSEDLKLKLSASREKSYYKSFDNLSQELLWDFTRPTTITEFLGELEYVF